MTLQDFQNLNFPDSPGVYFFLDESKNILYIGKATNLKSRVRSYFDDDILHTRGLHIGNMITVAHTVIFQETKSVLEALLLENELIKKHQPLYNTKEKDDKSYFVLAITDEDFPRVLLFRKRNLEKMIELNEVKIQKTFGPYTSGENAREALKVVRKIFPFRDKCEVFDRKKHSFGRNKCFSYELGLCPGTCRGVINKKNYAKHILRLIEFLEGNGERVRADLEKDMQAAAKSMEYEEAGRIKDILFALEHIRDAHLIKRDLNTEDDNRIEAYDVAHISGAYRVGVMSVLSGGIPLKSGYKKFKLKQDKNDDLEGLAEILNRRLKHLEWGLPAVIVVDGDERHARVAEKALDENGFKDVDVVAVTKDKSHKAKKLIGKKEILEKFQKEIILINAEAHRFALRYHRDLREKISRVKK